MLWAASSCFLYSYSVGSHMIQLAMYVIFVLNSQCEQNHLFTCQSGLIVIHTKWHPVSQEGMGIPAQVPVTSPALAIAKTMVLMTGEIDFENIFNEGDVFYNPMAYILCHFSHNRASFIHQSLG